MRLRLLRLNVDDQGDTRTCLRHFCTEQNVETNPAFRGAGTLRIVSANLLRNPPCSVRLVHIDGDSSDFRLALDASTNDGREIDSTKFGNDSLEDSRHDILLREQTLSMLIVGRVRIAKQQIPGRDVR